MSLAEDHQHDDAVDLLSVRDLKRRGWSASMIHCHLGTSWDRLVHNDNASATFYYSVERVEKIERSPEFIRDRELAERERVEITPEIAALIENVEIKVRRIDDLWTETLNAWVAREAKFGRVVERVPRAKMFKLAVNHVRHRVRYDGLDALAAKTSLKKAFELLTWRTLEEIAATYPELAEEAERQAWDHAPDGRPT